MAVRSMRTTAGWDQRTREKERKKEGTWNALSISFRLDRLVCFSQCFYSFGMRRLFFFSPLNSWHFSPLLCYLLIVFYFVFTVGSICLFFLPSISLLLNGNCQAPLKVDEETIREKGELFIRHTKTTPKEKENKEGRGLHILKWNTRQCCTCH